MNWDTIVTHLSPYIVRIDTPDGGGTGFLCLYNEDKSWIGLATAAHVISRADEWQQPIRLWQPDTSASKLLPFNERVVFINWAADSAVLLFKNDLSLPQQLIPLFPNHNCPAISRTGSVD
jgi:hypothetical protein